jgi:WD40 repeat protein
LVTGGKDKLVRVYDVNSGKLIHTLQGHTASICSMASN